MLGKLIKHEFRATGRIMLPLFLAVLILSAFAGLSIYGFERARDVRILQAMYGTTISTFFLSLFAVAVVAVVLMIQRFYKSLLRDEGYISMTLPVSVDAHIWAKLLTSFAWFALEAILSALAVGVVLSINVSLRDDLWIWDIFEEFRLYFEDLRGFNAVLYGIEYLVLSFLGACAFCLRCYASMAIGHSAANHKLLLSFLTWFAIGVALRMIGSVIFAGIFFSDMYWNYLDTFTVGADDTAHLFLVSTILGFALQDVVFYFLTRYFMKNKLNLP